MPRTALTDEERLMQNIEPTGFCWHWVGAMDDKGYGVATLPGRIRMRAHRWVYLTLTGSLPELPLDHLCRVRNCVNPDHLEPVTVAENARRGLNGPLGGPVRRYCKHGHDPLVVGLTPTGRCRQCSRDADRRYYARHGIGTVVPD